MRTTFPNVEAKQRRCDELADQYWHYRKADDADKAASVLRMLDQAVDTRIMRGDEGSSMTALCVLLGLDYLAPGHKVSTRSILDAHRWIGNVSGHFDDGYGCLFAWHDAGAATAEAVADVKGEMPYQWQGLPVTIDETSYLVDYCEGDLTITEVPR